MSERNGILFVLLHCYEEIILQVYFFQPYGKIKEEKECRETWQDGPFMLTSPSQQEPAVQISVTVKCKKVKNLYFFMTLAC